MKNTPPEPALTERDNARLLEDLCVALRDVGLNDYGLPDSERTLAAIGKVREIHAELLRRGVEMRPRLALLTEETSWQMEMLLADCLAYPSVIPYVREHDGIRRVLRCPLCSQHEFPDRQGISLCLLCLAATLLAIHEKVPPKGLLMFRFFNKAYWCKHADEETILMSFENEYDPLGEIWCRQCIVEEQQRRTDK